MSGGSRGPTEAAGVAVVTGAGRGLGRAVALAVAAAGFDVVVGHRASAAGAAEVVAAIEGSGRRALAVGGDVAEPATHAALADAAESLGPLTAWVNNAGVSVLAPVVDTSLEQLEEMCRVNLHGTFLGLQEAARRMTVAGTGGRIVNVASECGVQAFPLLGAYSATKFAVVGLTQAAALELAADGITVNAVCPGTAETDMVMAERASEVAITGRAADDVRASYLDGIPLGRFCDPEDVGALAAFLVGPGAAYLTGQAICTNGGSVLR